MHGRWRSTRSERMPASVLTPDLNELRGFCMAADLGSLGRAALRLHVSQPSLSKRLASLEAKVGARLLERSPRGVVLTPAGRRLYGQARALLEEADQVGRGDGSASATPARWSAWPPATRRPRRSSPGCSPTLDDGDRSPSSS